MLIFYYMSYNQLTSIYTESHNQLKMYMFDSLKRTESFECFELLYCMFTEKNGL